MSSITKMIFYRIARHFFPLVMVFFFLNPIAGQKKNYRFYYYTADQGLSQNFIDCILKDSRDYIWFGTRNGLNRFDSYEFTVYKKNQDNANSISSNLVQALCEDIHGNIWVGTNEGLNVYLFGEDRFISYTGDSIANLPIQNVSVNSILSDHSGALWIGTDIGILKITLNDDGKKILTSKYFNAVQVPGSLSGNRINCIYEDHYNRIWVGTGMGLNLYNPQTESFVAFRHNPSNTSTLSNDEVTAIFLDANDQLWVGTMLGLNRFDISKESFERYFHNPENPLTLVHNEITCISADLDGNVLIGTLGGLSIHSPKWNNFNNYTHDINSPYGINNDFINSILADEEGNIWIGTERGGVNRFNTFQNDFDYYVHIPGNKNSLSHNSVNSVLEGSDMLWIGTAGGGLNKLDKKTGNYTHFSNNPGDVNSLSSDFITSLQYDRNGNLWIGTWGNGLNLLDARNEESGKFIRFASQPGNPASLADNFVSSIIEDYFGNLWIGTRGGLVMHHPGTGLFDYVYADNSGIRISLVGCLEFDQDGNLWVGTEEGLYKLTSGNSLPMTPVNCRIKRYLKSPGAPGTISGNYVISIYSDRKGRLWIGTYGDGLNRLITDPITGEETFTNYTRNDGLVNNIVYGILEDDNGDLWLSTDNGLSKFNPETEEFMNYSLSDGLLSNQFYWSANYKNDDGRMYFGSMKGLLAFNPEKIIDREFRHKLSITEFMIYNQPVEIGRRYYDRAILEKPVSETDIIRLPYKIKEFSFGFSALDYDQTDKIRYKYMLKGFDEDWNYVGPERRFASYTNLKGGDYTLLINSVLTQGEWSNEPLSIQIQIIPPFWERWWFIASVVLILIISVAGFTWYRTFTLNERKKMLEILVKERTQQIEGQKEQLEMQNLEIIEQRDKLMDLNKKVQEANRQQMRFFTHMSHEFRTPLTLIISPLEEITSGMTERGSVFKKLLLVSKNAKRLQHLVNQLMEVRKIKTGNIGLKATKTDIVNFLENISQPFSSLAGQKNIDYDFLTDRKSILSWVDTEKLEIIFYNLVSNAIKYTPEQGRISIAISLIESGAIQGLEENVVIVRQKETCKRYVSIMVSDSGIGLESDQLKDVFKRFYKIPIDYNKHSYGTGIGLYLTKELIKAHRGWLFVSSIPGYGSDFICLLPYGKDFLKENEISEKTGKSYVLPGDTLNNSILNEYYESSQEEKPVPASLPRNELPAKRLILLVDDEIEFSNYVSEYLSKEFEVITAENGEEGLEKAKQLYPDLILSDNMMAKMDGFELCSIVKSDLQTSHIPFIIISARSDEEAMIEGLDSGADDYISKPLDLKVLKAKIRTLIENRQKLKKLFTSSLITDLKKVTTSPVDNKFLKHSIEIVEDHLTNSEFGVQSLADGLNISRSLLHKKLTAIVGQSANDFIVSIRLRHSAKLILEGNQRISQIAYQVGFNDPKYFTRCFKKHFGKTPSQYLQEQI